LSIEQATRIPEIDPSFFQRPEPLYLRTTRIRCQYVSTSVNIDKRILMLADRAATLAFPTGS
jgi:hypothetical protein